MASTAAYARQIAQMAIRHTASPLKLNGQLVRRYASEHAHSDESGGIKKMLYISAFCVIPLAVVASNSLNLYGNLHGTPRAKSRND